MPPCVLAPSGHKQSLPVCSEAHRPVGWARKQARVRRRCCGARGAGGGGREEAGRRQGSRRRTARAARAHLTLDPSLAEEVEPDDPEVDALAAQVAVETAAHQHGFPHYVIQGDNFTRTLTLRNSVARRFSHLETTRRRSHNRQLSKDFTKTVVPWRF